MPIQSFVQPGKGSETVRTLHYERHTNEAHHGAHIATAVGLEVVHLLLGKVVERDKFGVTIEWSDGNTSTMFFNDMKFVEKSWPPARSAAPLQALRGEAAEAAT